MTIYKMEDNDSNSDLEIFEKEIGFSKVIWHLAQSGKMILGHNMLTDVMQMLRQFFSSPLPEVNKTIFFPLKKQYQQTFS